MLGFLSNSIFRDNIEPKIQTLSSLQNSASIYQPKWRNVPLYLNHYQNLCDTLKYRTVKLRPKCRLVAEHLRWIWECDPVLINVTPYKAEEVSCELKRAIYRCRLIENKLVLKGCTSLTDNNETGNFIRPPKRRHSIEVLLCFFIQDRTHSVDVMTWISLSSLNIQEKCNHCLFFWGMFYALIILCLRLRAEIVRRLTWSKVSPLHARKG